MSDRTFEPGDKVEEWRPEHKYSVHEIREMRVLVERMWDFDNNMRSYMRPDKIAEVESILQTYMLNGTTTQELTEELDKVIEKLFKDYDEEHDT